MRADGRKKLRMAKREMQRSVTAHGSSRNGAVGAARPDAEAFFKCRAKIPAQGIFVANFSVMRIDIEGRSRGRSDDQEFTELPSFPKVFDEIPTAGVDEHLFVVAEAVKEIKNGKAAGFVRSRSLEGEGRNREQGARGFWWEENYIRRGRKRQTKRLGRVK